MYTEEEGRGRGKGVRKGGGGRGGSLYDLAVSSNISSEFEFRFVQ